MSIDITTLSIGDVVAEETVAVDRARLVRYAGASGDFNPIHWNERFAREVELPGVIAHGMWTMGAAIGIVERWCDDPTAITSYGARFTRPIPVPDPGEVEVIVKAVVGAIDIETGIVRIDLTVSVEGTRVLGKAQATVSL